MMVKELGEEDYSQHIENAIIKTAISLESLSAGKMGMSTSEVGDMVLNSLLNENE
jgi:3-isopropylmalate dehydrogenase